MNAKPQSKSMLEDILERPSDAEMIAQGLLPESCVFHVETALTYARKARKSCGGLKQPLDEIDVVIEHLQEIKKKLEGAK
jgi:hypothetical protein